MISILDILLLLITINKGVIDILTFQLSYPYKVGTIKSTHLTRNYQVHSLNKARVDNQSTFTYQGQGCYWFEVHLSTQRLH